MSSAIEVRNLQKSYSGFGLQNVSFCVPQGSIVGLIGENGAGKTTTIKAILNLIDIEGGEISVLGSPTKISKRTREDIGVVFDDLCFHANLSVSQLGKVMQGMYKRWDMALFKQYCQRFSLDSKKRVGDLSKGMKMKMGIAAAMSHGAKLLILDEATSGLDPVARDEVIDMLYEYTRDPVHSVLISSHIVTDLEKLCDYICFLKRGQVVLCEEKDAILEKYGVIRCSEKDMKIIPPEAVVGVKHSPYGVEAAVKRTAVPAGMSVGRLGIEELFVFMAKEEK